MAAISRAAAYAALYTRILTMTGVQFFSRRIKTVDQLSAKQQPAVFVIAGSSTPEVNSMGQPGVWRLRADIYVVAPPDQTGTAPEATLLGLVDQIDGLLLLRTTESRPSFHDQSETTLGNVVLKAYVSGPIEIDEGLDGEQGVALVPVEMLLVG